MSEHSAEETAVDVWQSLAECASERVQNDQNIDFYADYPRAQRRALAVCNNDCQVRLECLSYALKNEEVWGIWGGTTEDERRRALGVNEYGETHDWGDNLFCPNCRSTWIEIISKRRVRMTTRCYKCGFQWDRHRIAKKRRKRTDVQETI